MISIRSGVPGDIPHVLAQWSIATGPSTTDDAESLERLIEFAPDALLVATDQDQILGTVVVGWDGWRGTMYRLAVVPDRRREGIASTLVCDGEAILRSHGATRLHLIVESNGSVAQSFWSSIGYERTDQARFVKTFDRVAAAP